MIWLPLLLGVAPQTICIDPGHPSEVGRGAKGKSISEIEAAWKVGKLLEKELVSKGYKVVLTKSKMNQFVANKDRSSIANKANADLMVRLHCDAQGGSGFAVYYPTKQGKVDGKTGPSQSVLDRCAVIAPVFHQTMKKQLGGKLHDNGLMPDTKTLIGSKYGALKGSIHSEIPLVLVEMVRLTSKSDDKFIASKAGQELMAKALAAAVIESVPKPKVNK
ncbi:MAG TPA: N-acetylmuramoyl-L-alanine amidase [Fimbriimonas sp.]|nr:N-acetylmuramoyl-L-alanine amidase [Fimbriimonas sp.]